VARGASATQVGSVARLLLNDAIGPHRPSSRALQHESRLNGMLEFSSDSLPRCAGHPQQRGRLQAPARCNPLLLKQGKNRSRACRTTGNARPAAEMHPVHEATKKRPTHLGAGAIGQFQFPD
jgi:hypothetical protein